MAPGSPSTHYEKAGGGYSFTAPPGAGKPTCPERMCAWIVPGWDETNAKTRLIQIRIPKTEGRKKAEIRGPNCPVLLPQIRHRTPNPGHFRSQ
jgi:hypothetical protein